MNTTFFSRLNIAGLSLLILLSFNSFCQPVNDNDLELLDNGFVFLEGPLWYNDMLIFSDLDGDKIYQWDETNGSDIFLSPSGKSNGLAFDKDSNLLMAQRTYRQVARMDSIGNIVAIATHYKGHRLNCPNDIVVSSNGNIYFTDPTYGIQPGDKELNFQGIYCLTPDSTLYLLDSLLALPNGITLSPDQTKLYAGDTEVRNIYEYDIENDSVLANKRLFAHMAPSGYADGMKTDSSGRLFATGPTGIWVYDTAGTLIDNILVPEQVTNCNWGDADFKTLYITGVDGLYRIRPNYDVDTTDTTTSIIQFNRKDGNGIQKIYPSPFRDIVNIYFTIVKTDLVEVAVLNNLGQEIAVLTRETYAPGDFTVQWKPSNQSAGIYFVALQTTGGTSIKPCVFSGLQ
jgi:gluconolactonase